MPGVSTLHRHAPAELRRPRVGDVGIMYHTTCEAGDQLNVNQRFVWLGSVYR